MTVRPVVDGDLESVLRMARRFLSSEGPYGNRFALDEARVAAIAAHLMRGEHAIALLAERDGAAIGMFGMFVFEHPILGVRVAAELCWWIEPEARGSRVGLQLLRAGEAWARDQGVAVVEMIAPNERVAQFYERVGYERTDVHYLKTL